MSFLLTCIPAQLVSCASTCLCSACCSCCGSGMKKISLSSSIATRITYALLFLVSSGLAFIATTDVAVRWIESWSSGYLHLNCGDDACYGFVMVHKICFALTVFHLILAGLTVGVEDTSHSRATVQNRYWPAKFGGWLILLVGSAFLPASFIRFWGGYVALFGASAFILIQLLLLVDFAHTFAETCLEKWENDDNDRWKMILVASTVGLFVLALVLSGLMYGFFAGKGCHLNQFFISFNVILGIVVAIMAIHPSVQDANPRSGLTQAGLVVAYGTYLIISSIVNQPNEPGFEHCNPLDHVNGTRTTSMVLGAIFTLVAIAYSTSRAATQSSDLLSSTPNSPGGGLPLDLPNYRDQAIREGLASGSLRPSDIESGEDEGEVKDDEREGVAYSYSLFHLVFAIAAMYVSMLVTNWNSIDASDNFITIGRSIPAMWVKVASSWVCYLLYGWTLVGPLVLPDREWL